MKAYICGPMTGKPNSNRERFIEVGNRLRSQGFDIFNPAEQDDSIIEGQIPEKGIEWARKEFLKRDIPELYNCDFVVVLDEWAESKGAMLEIHNALWMGKPILYEKDLQPVSYDLLQLWLVKEVIRMTEYEK